MLKFIKIFAFLLLVNPLFAQDDEQDKEVMPDSVNLEETIPEEAEEKPIVPKILPMDSSKVTIRKNKTSLSEIRQDIDYQYGDSPENLIENWWNRMWRKFWGWVNSFFSNPEYGLLRRVLLITFLGAVAVFVILKMMGIDVFRLIKRKSEDIIPYDTLSETIHGRDFMAEIDEALANKNYRLAVRLYYLKSLKSLSDREMINWKPNRTNRSYYYDLTPAYQQGFDAITRSFEYAWYGDFPINEVDFNNIRTDFEDFERK